MLTDLKGFVDSKGRGATPFIFGHVEDARKTAKYLIRLGLSEDALHLTQAWVNLHRWTFGPVMDEIFAKIAIDEPDNGQWLRKLYGDFPSADELAASQHKRKMWRLSAVSLASELADQLQKVQEAVSGSRAADIDNCQSSVDNSAFRPASEFLDSTDFRTYKLLRAALKKNTQIRTRKPSPQRLEIHAGDWLKFLNGQTASVLDALDTRNETAIKTVSHFLNETHQQIANRKKLGK